jgi:methyl-accepting chemotaxis protein
MPASLLPSTATGQLFLQTIFCFVALFAGGFFYQRLRGRNRRLANALDNMSQGLVMFDGNSRIVVVNQQYVEMYGLSPQIVHPGCTLRQLGSELINSSALTTRS